MKCAGEQLKADKSDVIHTQLETERDTETDSLDMFYLKLPCSHPSATILLSHQLINKNTVHLAAGQKNIFLEKIIIHLLCLLSRRVR